MPSMFIKIKKQELKKIGNVYGFTKLGTKFGHALVVIPNKAFTEAKIINDWTKK